MRTITEIFADEKGGLIVEKRTEGWVFVPNNPVGRPRKLLSFRRMKSDPIPVDPREVLPATMHVDSWRVS